MQITPRRGLPRCPRHPLNHRAALGAGNPRARSSVHRSTGQLRVLQPAVTGSTCETHGQAAPRHGGMTTAPAASHW